MIPSVLVGIINLACEYNKVVTENLSKIELSVDFENAGKNTQFKIWCKSEVEFYFSERNKTP